MTDDDNNNSRPGIPVWQRAQQPLAAEKTTSDARENASPTTAGSKELTHAEAPVPTEEDTVASKEPEEPAADWDSTPGGQRQQMQTFLDDPAVKDAPLEKKRAFFESKGIPKHLIDEALHSFLNTSASTPTSTFQPSEFESFKQQHRPTPTPQPAPAQSQAGSPPIITYPEFLVEAHKPPPLITPGRILNATYFAAGFSALVYGASKYLVQPMAASLTDARHDFATHSRVKIDEMNGRLEKIVSKVPAEEARQEHDEDDDGSETSDPTELYHRDMGTQTSPLPSRRSSTSSDSAAKQKNPPESHISNLSTLKQHLETLISQSETLATANKERQDKTNNLRHYLDTVMFASPGINAWGATEDAEKKDDKQADAVEELKKEIRGVKGVLLSAKRFPGVAARPVPTLGTGP